MHKTPHLLIIGGASLDTLHFKNETVLSIGGAGMYTAMAARKRCPEMTIPKCEKCSVEIVCAKKKELFQPVYRTTFY